MVAGAAAVVLAVAEVAVALAEVDSAGVVAAMAVAVGAALAAIAAMAGEVEVAVGMGAAREGEEVAMAASAALAGGSLCIEVRVFFHVVPCVVDECHVCSCCASVLPGVSCVLVKSGTPRSSLLIEASSSQSWRSFGVGRDRRRT